MPPIRLFVPYGILRHIFNVAVGYGGTLKSKKANMSVAIETFESVLPSEVFWDELFEEKALR